MELELPITPPWSSLIYQSNQGRAEGGVPTRGNRSRSRSLPIHPSSCCVKRRNAICSRRRCRRGCWHGKLAQPPASKQPPSTRRCRSVFRAFRALGVAIARSSPYCNGEQDGAMQFRQDAEGNPVDEARHRQTCQPFTSDNDCAASGTARGRLPATR